MGHGKRHEEAVEAEGEESAFRWSRHEEAQEDPDAWKASGPSAHPEAEGRHRGEARRAGFEPQEEAMSGKKKRRRDDEADRLRMEQEQLERDQRLAMSERSRRARSILGGATGDVRMVGAPTILGG